MNRLLLPAWKDRMLPLARIRFPLNMVTAIRTILVNACIELGFLFPKMRAYFRFGHFRSANWARILNLSFLLGLFPFLASRPPFGDRFPGNTQFLAASCLRSLGVSFEPHNDFFFRRLPFMQLIKVLLPCSSFSLIFIDWYPYQFADFLGLHIVQS